MCIVCMYVFMCINCVCINIRYVWMTLLTHVYIYTYELVCMYMYICMHVFWNIICTCMFIGLYNVSIYRRYVCIYGYMYVCKYVRMNVCMYVHVYMYVPVGMYA